VATFTRLLLSTIDPHHAWIEGSYRERGRVVDDLPDRDIQVSLSPSTCATRNVWTWPTTGCWDGVTDAPPRLFPPKAEAAFPGFPDLRDRTTDLFLVGPHLST
jgi:hypothetical protein